MSIVWLDKREILLFHGELIAEHGGFSGPPDEGVLESTLARPRHLKVYHSDRSIYELAASYGYGFARNHCFPDGNKRIALVAMDVFLGINGYEFSAVEADAVVTIRALAAGDISEADLAAWIEANICD